MKIINNPESLQIDIITMGIVNNTPAERKRWKKQEKIKQLAIVQAFNNKEPTKREKVDAS